MARELLFSVTRKDLRIDTFRAGGKGGQNQNKRQTGVRITHPPSGAVGQARDERQQEQNMKLAFRRMVADPKFKAWLRVETAVRMGVIQSVDEMMAEKNLKIEMGVDISEKRR